MSTRSFITYKTENGFKGVYCHSDGDLSYNGKILSTHYTDASKVIELIENGSISSLDKEIGDKHCFINRPEGQTTFYGRDRGDKNSDAVSAFTIKSMQRCAAKMGCEYFYVFIDGVWEYAMLTERFLTEYPVLKPIATKSNK